MTVEQHQIRNIGRRAGIFDERYVTGIHFEDERAIRGWHVTTWMQNHHRIDDYWVETDKFYEMLRVDTAGYPGVKSRIETGRLIVDMDAAKRATILKALAQWESEES